MVTCRGQKGAVITLAAFFPFALLAAGAAAQPEIEATSPKLRYYYPLPLANPPQIVQTDLCVYGATPGGVAAAIQARRMGKRAVLVEFGRHVGGLTSGGLSATDGGGKDVAGGIAREFYDRVGQAGFRPSVAEAAFRDMLRQAEVPIFTEHRLKSVKKSGNRITEIEVENGNVFRAKVFIDGTYEGDLMAKAGVSYTVGREGNAKYGETINGIWNGGGHDFTVPVDPYVVEGNPASGLLPEISAADPGKPGEGDKRIQAYCFRMRLTNDPNNRLPFPRPRGYDRARYALLARYLKAGAKGLRPGIDVNNHHLGDGAFFIDYVGGNYQWPEADYATRERIFQDHVTYQQGVMWFLAHDESVREDVRTTLAEWGLPKDEYVETGGWTHQLYIREARRMVSDYVMTEHNCRGKEVAADSIGIASYNMDSHHCQRVVVNGRVTNEGNVEVRPKQPYPVAYRAIIPKEAECANLLVPVCLSASHIAYGSIRMEPVFMVLGQSAGTAACLAIDAGGVAVQRVDAMKLRARLIADKQILDWRASGAQ